MLEDHEHEDDGHSHSCSASSTATPHDHGYTTYGYGLSFQCGSGCGATYGGRTEMTEKAAVNVSTTCSLTSQNSNLGGVDTSNSNAGHETRPANMKVLYIIRIFQEKRFCIK